MSPEQISLSSLYRYNNLFDWIVGRVNISMKPKAATDCVIGVLDI